MFSMLRLVEEYGMEYNRRGQNEDSILLEREREREGEWSGMEDPFDYTPSSPNAGDPQQLLPKKNWGNGMESSHFNYNTLHFICFSSNFQIMDVPIKKFQTME